ncbi:MAG: hypothetical protein R3F60_01340 [bacterium]
MRIALVLLLVGCGGGGEAPAEGPAACTKVGQQCRLPAGPLGVCQRGESAGFVCTPQH